jgi:hypothetical protein
MKVERIWRVAGQCQLVMNFRLDARGFSILSAEPASRTFRFRKRVQLSGVGLMFVAIIFNPRKMLSNLSIHAMLLSFQIDYMSSASSSMISLVFSFSDLHVVCFHVMIPHQCIDVCQCSATKNQWRMQSPVESV